MIDYKSPIEIEFTDVVYEIANDLDKEVYRAISRYNVNVNEEELIKALQYDRQQYDKGYEDGYKDGFNADKWISCEVEMPKEHDSMFSKLKGTDKWSDAMFEKTSDDVNVTIELEDGSRITKTAHTIDGKWSVEINSWIKQKVIAWQPLPQPCKKEGAVDEL